MELLEMEKDATSLDTPDAHADHLARIKEEIRQKVREEMHSEIAAYEQLEQQWRHRESAGTSEASGVTQGVHVDAPVDDAKISRELALIPDEEVQLDDSVAHVVDPRYSRLQFASFSIT